MWNGSTEDRNERELGECAGRFGKIYYFVRISGGSQGRWTAPAKNGWGSRATPEIASDSGLRRGSITRHQPRTGDLDSVQL